MATIDDFLAQNPSFEKDVSATSGIDTVQLGVSVVEIASDMVKFMHLGQLFSVDRSAVVALDAVDMSTTVPGTKPATLIVNSTARVFVQQSMLAKDLCGYVPFAMAISASPPIAFAQSEKIQKWMEDTGYSRLHMGSHTMESMAGTTHWTISQCPPYGGDDSMSDPGH